MTDYVSFGRYLRQQRELRGLSVDDVARSTKISPTLVEALEDGQAERFPERVFVLNFIRSYATTVGFSGDDAVNRFEEIPGAPKAVEFDPRALELVRRERAITMLWVTIAAVLTVATAVVFQALHEYALRFANR